MASSVEPQARRWVFTVFEGHITNGMDLHEWFSWFQAQAHVGVRYIVCQLETATTTQRVHVQGYMHWSKVKRPSTIGSIYGLKATAFQQGSQRATPADNRAYCTEEEKRLSGTQPWEFGECPGGQGTRLKQVAAVIKDKGLKRAIEESPETYITCGRGMRDLDRFYKRQKTRGDWVQVIVIHGDSGAGKTWWAKQLFDPGHTFVMPAVPRNGNAWFDGYDNERTLVIDEMSGRIEFELFKNMLDPGELQVPVKGDYTPAMWNTVIITTNNHPNSWYGNDVDSWGVDPDKVSPVERRIHVYIEATGNYKKGTHSYIVNSWTRNLSTAPLKVLPTRDEVERSEEQPESAEAAPSNPVEEDVDLDELLGEWKVQDEQRSNDYMPDSFIATDTDFERLLDGGVGDEEPTKWLDLFDVE